MKSIFISHVEQEKAQAAALVIFIRQVLGNRDLKVFLSSDINSIRGGDKWEEKIRKAIKSCGVFVAMCSNRSFDSHWLHLEIGAAWGLGKPILPVCYGGKERGKLPRPYSSFTAVDLVPQAWEFAVTLHGLLQLQTPPPPAYKQKFLSFSNGPQESIYSSLANAFNPWL